MGIGTLSVKVLSCFNRVRIEVWNLNGHYRQMDPAMLQTDSPPLKHYPVMSLKTLSESSTACPYRQVRDGSFLLCRQVFVWFSTDRQVITNVTKWPVSTVQCNFCGNITDGIRKDILPTVTRVSEYRHLCHTVQELYTLYNIYTCINNISQKEYRFLLCPTPTKHALMHV